jgi:hypothetical protein
MQTYPREKTKKPLGKTAWTKKTMEQYQTTIPVGHV